MWYNSVMSLGLRAADDSLYELGITHEITSEYPIINNYKRCMNCKYNLVLELSSNRDVFNLVTTSCLYL